MATTPVSPDQAPEVILVDVPVPPEKPVPESTSATTFFEALRVFVGQLHGRLEEIKKQGIPGRLEDYIGATTVTPEVEVEVNKMFGDHPLNGDQIAVTEFVRMALANAVKVIIGSVPPGADRESAIRKIREAKADCYQAITFGNVAGTGSAQ